MVQRTEVNPTEVLGRQVKEPNAPRPPQTLLVVDLPTWPENVLLQVQNEVRAHEVKVGAYLLFYDLQPEIHTSMRLELIECSHLPQAIHIYLNQTLCQWVKTPLLGAWSQRVSGIPPLQFLLETQRPEGIELVGVIAPSASPGPLPPRTWVGRLCREFTQVITWPAGEGTGVPKSPAPEVIYNVVRRRKEIPSVGPHARCHAALLAEEEEGQVRIIGHLLEI